MTSEKSKTNKKWTSSKAYKDNYDKVFAKKSKWIFKDTKGNKYVTKGEYESFADAMMAEEELYTSKVGKNFSAERVKE